MMAPRLSRPDVLWICRGCTAAYSVGAPRCPQCGGTSYCEQGSEEHEDMAKITKAGGPSDQADGAPLPSAEDAAERPLGGEFGPELVDLPGDEPGYDSMTSADLREELSRRKGPGGDPLPTTGRRRS